MNMSETDRWIQVATTISILIGLGLVIWELQQVKTLARALRAVQSGHKPTIADVLSGQALGTAPALIADSVPKGSFYSADYKANQKPK